MKPKFNFLFIISILSLVMFSNCQKKSDELKIGVIAPLTGDIAIYGQSAKNGMEIALEEEKDFINRNNIKVLYEDDKNETRTAVNAANKLILIDDCKIILEAGSSSCVLSIAPIAENNKRILIATFASSPLITNAGDYVFRIMPSDAYQASLLPYWMKEFGVNKVAIVYQKNDWGLALRDKFKEEWIKFGGNIVFDEGIENQQKEFRSLIFKIRERAKDAEALFLPLYPIEAAHFLKQLYESKLKLMIFGADMFDNQELIKIAGIAAENVRFLAPMPYYGKEYEQFAHKFQSKFNEKPNLPASAGYDAMKTVLKSIKELQNNKLEITVDNIKSYLYKNIDFIGATGKIKFDENGDPIGKTFSKRIIQNGQIIEIKD